MTLLGKRVVPESGPFQAPKQGDKFWGTPYTSCDGKMYIHLAVQQQDFACTTDLEILPALQALMFKTIKYRYVFFKEPEHVLI